MMLTPLWIIPGPIKLTQIIHSFHTKCFSCKMNQNMFKIVLTSIFFLSLLENPEKRKCRREENKIICRCFDARSGGSRWRESPPPFSLEQTFPPRKIINTKRKTSGEKKKMTSVMIVMDDHEKTTTTTKKKLRPMNKLEVIGTNIFSKQRPIIIYNNDRYFSLWFSRLRVYRREDEKKNKESDWTRQHPLCVYQWRELKWRRKNKIDDEWRPPHSQRNFTVMCLSLF